MRLSRLNIKKINLDNIDSNYSGQDILMKLGELYQFESGIYGYGNLWVKLERIVEEMIIDASGSEYIVNIVKNKEFNKAKMLVKYIEAYFKDNGGKC